MTCETVTTVSLLVTASRARTAFLARLHGSRPVLITGTFPINPTPGPTTGAPRPHSGTCSDPIDPDGAR